MMEKFLKWFKKRCNLIYTSFKKVCKALIPKGVLIRNEFFFRKIASAPYLGNNYECNICEVSLRSFIHNNNDLLCPACGSLSRTRQLWNYLNSNAMLHGNVLHFSPSSILHKKMQSLHSINYTSTDYENEFEAMEKFDITDLPVEDESFDLIICYHVLEHVENDRTAMKELYRVLKPQGALLVQTPFKNGDIYENPDVKTESERLKEYGQEDHVRIYSADGLISRFKAINLNTDIKKIDLTAQNYHGMVQDTVLHISKTTSN